MACVVHLESQHQPLQYSIMDTHDLRTSARQMGFTVGAGGATSTEPGAGLGPGG